MRRPRTVGPLSSSLPSHPWLPPHIKLGHSVIVPYERANPERNSGPDPLLWGKRINFLLYTPICLTSLQKRFNFSQAWLGGIPACAECSSPNEATLQQRQTLPFSLQHTGKNFTFAIILYIHARPLQTTLLNLKKSVRMLFNSRKMLNIASKNSKYCSSLERKNSYLVWGA